MTPKQLISSAARRAARKGCEHLSSPSQIAYLVDYHGAIIEHEFDWVEGLIEALTAAKIAHYDCEDCWYSCPKSKDGCCDENQGDECNCGANKHNAAIDAVLAAIPQGENE